MRLTSEELRLIRKKCNETTCRKLSEYIRQVLLNGPVTIRHRDQSVDEILQEMTLLRGELGRVGNNFNQSTKRLNTLSQLSEFRSQLEIQDAQNASVIGLIEEIKTKISKLADRWLQ